MSPDALDVEMKTIFWKIVAPIGTALICVLAFASFCFAIDDADGIISDFNKTMAYAYITLANIIAFSMLAWAIKTAPEQEAPVDIDPQPPPLSLQYCLMCIFPALVSIQLILHKLTALSIQPYYRYPIIEWFETGILIFVMFLFTIAFTWTVNVFSEGEEATSENAMWFLEKERYIQKNTMGYGYMVSFKSAEGGRRTFLGQVWMVRLLGVGVKGMEIVSVRSIALGLASSDLSLIFASHTSAGVHIFLAYYLLPNDRVCCHTMESRRWVDL